MGVTCMLMQCRMKYDAQVLLSSVVSVHDPWVDGAAVLKGADPAATSGQNSQSGTQPEGGVTVMVNKQKHPAAALWSMSQSRTQPEGGTTTMVNTQKHPAAASWSMSQRRTQPEGGTTTMVNTQKHPAAALWSISQRRTQPEGGMTTMLTTEAPCSHLVGSQPKKDTEGGMPVVVDMHICTLLHTKKRKACAVGQS